MKRATLNGMLFFEMDFKLKGLYEHFGVLPMNVDNLKSNYHFLGFADTIDNDKTPIPTDFDREHTFILKPR